MNAFCGLTTLLFTCNVFTVFADDTKSTPPKPNPFRVYIDQLLPIGPTLGIVTNSSFRGSAGIDALFVQGSLDFGKESLGGEIGANLLPAILSIPYVASLIESPFDGETGSTIWTVGYLILDVELGTQYSEVGGNWNWRYYWSFGTKIPTPFMIFKIGWETPFQSQFNQGRFYLSAFVIPFKWPVI
jgi:hypothetical protein